MLGIHTPTLQQELRRHGNNGYCHHAPGTHRTLQGRTPCGEWLSAPAKEYPAALCATLARFILQSIAKWAHLKGTTDHEQDHLADLYQPLDPYF